MHNFNWSRITASCGRGAALAALLLVGVIASRPAAALPLFARQTGAACAACHTVYPELTHFGRMFKLNGYQLDNGRDLEMISDEGKSVLSLAGGAESRAVHHGGLRRRAKRRSPTAKLRVPIR